MWRPWSLPLELLGRFRLRLGFLTFFSRTRVVVGNPGSRDARESWAWREYLKSHQLFDVWGPLPEGPWAPFHCVPLFAAIEHVPKQQLGPTKPPEQAEWGSEGAAPAGAPLPSHVRPHGRSPAWASPSTWVMLELPGPASVEAAAWLVTSAGYQPVCTFDNWPHHRGVLKAERILGELLRWASTIAEVRGRLTDGSPPLWICDAERLGGAAGRPGEFDNRYYLDDSILPGPALLRRQGISRLVYVTPTGDEVPLADVEAYFADLLAGGIEVLHVGLADPSAEPRPFSAPAKPRKPPRSGFRRSAAGGFGTDVPEPSSGGGGG
jgi:hypothetical protein